MFPFNRQDANKAAETAAKENAADKVSEVENATGAAGRPKPKRPTMQRHPLPLPMSTPLLRPLTTSLIKKPKETQRQLQLPNRMQVNKSHAHTVATCQCMCVGAKNERKTKIIK